jgi:peptidoglycan-associated lipoprotein
LQKAVVLVALAVIVCAGCSRTRRLLTRLWHADDSPAANLPSLEIPPPPEIIPSGGPFRPTAPPAGQTDNDTAGMRREPATTTVPELRTTYFDYDSAELSEQARQQLEENAQWLIAHGTVEVLIEGHCDERGTIEYNFNLGQRRADTVKTYLVRLGVDPGRLHTISYGEARPAVRSHDEDAWRQNRRTEFHVY